ncbi:6230_t:CDS:2 [Funneliformis mosseae]|uniref:6230_t:CDS:1 n=1 Tax=Funneliformis mosseae TaxID=27381 RepID=A0A9N9EM39_FUNMO|nr:6230_t:CDS:2 [Funneliformis mosseae]
MSFAEESPPIDISHNETPPISKNKGGKPENDDNTDKNNIYLDNILDLNAPEFLEGLDEFIEDSDINLEEEANNDKINQEEIDEDWDPKLAVEAYL